MGMSAKQQIIAKVKTLRDRFETVQRRNASLPLAHRLKMDEMSPDLLLNSIWLGREWDRAKQIV